jgi:phosphoglycolate phosphatase
MDSIRYIIFDWDGTLMDSAPRIVSAMQETARVLGLEVPEEAAVKQIIGLSLEHVFERLFPKVPESEHHRLFEEYKYQYIEGNHADTPLFDGVEETLFDLKMRGFELAIATGKRRAGLERVMQNLAVRSLFSDSICAGEAKGKPDPDMLLQLTKRNAWPVEQCVMIGDTSHDLEMANKAKVASIGVSYGAHPVETLIQCSPKLIIDDIRELQNLFGIQS